jgi:hypothetical protein
MKTLFWSLFQKITCTLHEHLALALETSGIPAPAYCLGTFRTAGNSTKEGDDGMRNSRCADEKRGGQ